MAKSESVQFHETEFPAGLHKAVRPEGPLAKPPKEYRDRSEFKGSEKRASLESIREGAALEAAKEHNPLAKQWEQERKAHEEKLTRWTRDFLGSSPQAVIQKLEEQFDAAKAAGNDKDFKSDVSEVLYRMRQLKTHDNPFVKDVIAGMETFLRDQAIVVSPEAKATQKKLRVEEQARQEAQRRENYAREMPAIANPNAETQPNMTAITPQEQDWFDKGDRGEVKEDDDNLGGGMVGRLAGRH